LIRRTDRHRVITDILLLSFYGLFSRTTWVNRYKKGKLKTSLDRNEARDDGVWGWQLYQMDHMQTICTSLQTDNHTNTSSLDFYRPDALPTTVQALKADIANTMAENNVLPTELKKTSSHIHYLSIIYR